MTSYPLPSDFTFSRDLPCLGPLPPGVLAIYAPVTTHFCPLSVPQVSQDPLVSLISVPSMPESWSDNFKGLGWDRKSGLTGRSWGGGALKGTGHLKADKLDADSGGQMRELGPG